MNGGPWGSRDSFLGMLSRREREALSLLVEGGYPTKEIARRMELREITVKVHLKGVYRKLGVENRTQAVLRVFELGLSNMGATKGELVGGLGL